MGPQIQNVTLICCFFTWRMQGLTRNQNILPVTTSKKKFYLTFLNVSPDTNFFSNDNFAARVPRGREKKFADFFKLNS